MAGEMESHGFNGRVSESKMKRALDGAVGCTV